MVWFTRATTPWTVGCLSNSAREGSFEKGESDFIARASLQGILPEIIECESQEFQVLGVPDYGRNPWRTSTCLAEDNLAKEDSPENAGLLARLNPHIAGRRERVLFGLAQNLAVATFERHPGDGR